MCAMLALVAPEELKVELGRTIQFVEAYVGECARSCRPTTSESFPLDMLVRYRLHASAAYLRKYSRVEEVQKTTRVRPLNHTLHPISQSAKTARDRHLHRVPKVPKARGRHAFEKPVCEGDACGVCDMQGGGGEMFDMVRGFGSRVGQRGCAERAVDRQSSSRPDAALSVFGLFARGSSRLLQAVLYGTSDG